MAVFPVLPIPRILPLTDAFKTKLHLGLERYCPYAKYSIRKDKTHVKFL